MLTDESSLPHNPTRARCVCTEEVVQSLTLVVCVSQSAVMFRASLKLIRPMVAASATFGTGALYTSSCSGATSTTTTTTTTVTGVKPAGVVGKGAAESRIDFSGPSSTGAAHRRLRLVGKHLDEAAALTKREHLRVTVDSSSSIKCRIVLQSEEAAGENPLASSADWKHDFSGKAGQSAVSYGVDGGRIIAVGLGKQSSLRPEEIRKAMAQVWHK